MRDLFAPGLDADCFLERVFVFINRLLPTDLTGYGVLDGKTKQLDANFDNHPPGLMQALESYGRLMHTHEAFRFDPAVNGGKPYSMGDYFTHREFREIEIYHEVHKPLGFDDLCYVHVPGAPDASIYLGLFREGHEFTVCEKELLTFAQAHLQNARHLALMQSTAREAPLNPEVFAHKGFTPRESEVIYWLTQGKSNSEIAHLMHVRTDTISGYLKTIYEKMGVENRVAATVSALDLAKKAHLHQQHMESGRVLMHTACR